MAKMKKYRILLYEWDCDNGDMLWREEITIEAKSFEEAKERAWREVELLVAGAEKEGWEKVTETDHSIVLSKPEVGTHEVGFEITELR